MVIKTNPNYIIGGISILIIILICLLIFLCCSIILALSDPFRLFSQEEDNTFY